MLILLLPQPPEHVNLHTLRAAYGPALSEVLRSASVLSAKRISAILDIVIDCPEQHLHQAPRTRLYIRLQRLFGLLYSLIVQICTKESIDVKFGNEVNSRIVLLNSNHSSTVKGGVGEFKEPQAEGPIIDIYSLTQCINRWKILYFVDSVQGKALLARFINAQESLKKDDTDLVFEKVRDGSNLREQESELPTDNYVRVEPQKDHCAVAVGGSFDHLHPGHKLLLTMTAAVLEPNVNKENSQCRKLTIGISGDELLKNKKFADELQNWNDRQAAVRKFLLGILDFRSPIPRDDKNTAVRNIQHEQGRTLYDNLESGLQIEYVEISDPYGPTITDEKISALVLSRETRAGGKAVNDKRLAKGWAALEIFEVDVLDSAGNGDNVSNTVDQDFASKISSTEIRRKLHEKRRSSVEMSEGPLGDRDSSLGEVDGVELRRMLHELHESSGSRVGA